MELLKRLTEEKVGQDVRGKIGIDRESRQTVRVGKKNHHLLNKLDRGGRRPRCWYLYIVRRGSSIISLSNTPSVQYLILVCPYIGDASMHG